MSRSYKLTLKSEFREAEKVLPFVESISRENRFEKDLEERVKLALSEAATNAIVHGNKEDTGMSVSIRVEVDSEMLTILVRDEGEGFDPDDIPDPIRKEQLLSTGGRGIFLIREYCDEVEFHEDGRQIVLTFRR